MDYTNHRKHPRFIVRAPLEVHAEDSNTPIRCATADLSLGGCYVETMFPFPVGTVLELKLWLDDALLLIQGKVVASYPLVGNGIEFMKILPEDLDQLRTYLDKVAAEEAAKAEKAEKKE